MSSESEYESDEDFQLDAVDTEYQEDFIKYAVCEMGLEVESGDADLAWLAWEAYTRPPPEGWSEHTDPTGRVYFHNWATRESTWTHPDDEMFKSLLEIIKSLRAERPLPSEARRFQAMQDHIALIYKVAEADLKDWSGPYSKEGGGDYFYNESLKESVWENPTERWERELANRQAVLHRCLLIDWPNADEPLSKASSTAEVRSLAHASAALEPSLTQRDDDEMSAESAKSHQTMHTCRSARTARSDRSTRSGRSARNARSRSQTPRGKRSATTSDVSPPSPPAPLPVRLHSQTEFLPRFGAAADEEPAPLRAELHETATDIADIEGGLLLESKKAEMVDIEKALPLDSEEKPLDDKAPLQDNLDSGVIASSNSRENEKAEAELEEDGSRSRENAKAEAEVEEDVSPVEASISTGRSAKDVAEDDAPPMKKLSLAALESRIRAPTADVGSPARRKTSSDDVDVGPQAAVAVPALAAPALELRLKNALDAFVMSSPRADASLELDPFVNPDQRPRARSAVEQYPGLRCEMMEGRLKVFKDDSLKAYDGTIKGDVVDNADVAGGLAAEKSVVDSDLIKKCAEDDVKQAGNDLCWSARQPYSSPRGSVGSAENNNVQFFNIYDAEAVGDEDGDEVDKVRQWLRKMGLGRYFEQLELQGFDNMNILAALDEEQLKVLMEVVPMPFLHEQQLRRGLARLNADVRSDEVKVSAS